MTDERGLAARTARRRDSRSSVRCASTCGDAFSAVEQDEAAEEVLVLSLLLQSPLLLLLLLLLSVIVPLSLSLQSLSLDVASDVDMSLVSLVSSLDAAAVTLAAPKLPVGAPRCSVSSQTCTHRSVEPDTTT